MLVQYSSTLYDIHEIPATNITRRPQRPLVNSPHTTGIIYSASHFNGMSTMAENSSASAEVDGLFHTLSMDGREVELQIVLERLHRSGLMDQRDPRLKPMKTVINEIGGRGKCIYGVKLDIQGFTKLIEIDRHLMLRALVDDLVIPNFKEFVDKVKYCFEVQQANIGGAVPDEKCPLHKANPDSWGLAICTVDGQRCFLGHHDASFSMKGIAKPFVLGYALKKFGIPKVEEFVGHFQTHETCDLLCFDDTKKPINAMVTSGYIALCSLILGMDKKECVAGELQEYSNYVNELTANEFNQMNTHKVMKEKQDGHTAIAIAHFLKSLHVLPDHCNIELGLDLFYETNSTEVNCESLSVMAATLANSGINPLTGNKVIKKKFVKYMLSLMFSSGLGGYSGNAAVTLGQPSKSSNSGGIIVVIPGLFGLAAFSPKLDSNQISVRGLGFVEHFVNHMGYHPYQKLSERLQRKFPTRKIVTTQCNQCCQLFSAVVNGDFMAVVRLTETPEAAFVKDSYKRTALHVAAAHQHMDIIKYLCEKFSALAIQKDRWGRKPLAYAPSSNYQVQAKLREWEQLMGEKDISSGSGDIKKKKREDGAPKWQ